MKPLTPRQSEILFAIYMYAETHGRTPTYRALGETLGITRFGATNAVEVLANKGHIELRGGIKLPARSGGTLELLEKKRHA